MCAGLLAARLRPAAYMLSDHLPLVAVAVLQQSGQSSTEHWTEQRWDWARAHWALLAADGGLAVPQVLGSPGGAVDEWMTTCPSRNSPCALTSACSSRWLSVLPEDRQSPCATPEPHLQTGQPTRAASMAALVCSGAAALGSKTAVARRPAAAAVSVRPAARSLAVTAMAKPTKAQAFR